MHSHSPLSLSPLSPLPLPPRRPAEVFPDWWPAQQMAGRHATAPLPSVTALRNDGYLDHARAHRIAAWYVSSISTPGPEVEAAYEALAHEVDALAHAVTARPPAGGLGVTVRLTLTDDEPYADAAQLCTDLRTHRTMTLRAAAADPPHPLLSNTAVDQLRTVHDALGHAALGVGFDLQSEYATWLYCRLLFSPAARPAAFCELVGAVTTHVLTGDKPALRADLPPAALLG